MSRFRTSKYKNAAPRDRHEPWVRDLSIGSYSGFGNFITASASFVAFNVQTTGSQLGVVGLDHEGTVGANIPILNAHSDQVTDFDFSPFEDGLLATCSADSTVKIWSLHKSYPNDLSTLTPDAVTSCKRRVETVNFNPTAEFLLGYTSQNQITLWDVIHNKEVFNDMDTHGDMIMSFSWSQAGSMLCTSSKDKKLRIMDPRANVVTTAPGYVNNKESRVLWLGDSHYILSTGFDNARKRVVTVRDVRKFSSTIFSADFDSSTGILIPLYDPDTKMTFLCGRGDTSIIYMEFSETEPILNEGYRYHGDQTKGACLTPKRALNVMQTEVNRIIQLTHAGIVCIPYYVPRKSYSDFHDDLYPKTRGTSTTSTAANWANGLTGTVAKISLDPSVHRSSEGLVVFKSDLGTRRSEEEKRIAQTVKELEMDKGTPPEPRPRKISISSSSDEGSDILVNRGLSSHAKLIPVPRPRVNNNNITSALRTPSSFISSKRTAGAEFGRCTSLDSQIEAFAENQPIPAAQQPQELEMGKNVQNVSPENQGSVNSSYENGCGSGDAHNNLNNKKTNGHSKPSNESTNGSSASPPAKDEADGAFLSTNERRKLFESRSVSMHEGNTNLNDLPQPRKRLTVAERLKMFQQGQNSNNNNSTDESETGERRAETTIEKNSEKFSKINSNNAKNIETINNGSKEVKKQVSSNKPPFEKPERKFSKSQQEIISSTPSKPPSKRIDTVFGRVSKYRNFKAASVHKRMHIENLRNISTTCPNESELIQANPERFAVPLSTPGGKLAIYELSTPGKQPDGVIPALVHGTPKIMDFSWDPFDNYCIVVGTDDGRIWGWRIAQGGLKEQTNEPEYTIAAHAEKIYFLRFHPLAKNVLASGSYDLTIRIWDLTQKEAKILIQLEAEQKQIFSFAWSPCGSKFSTATKDGYIRVYDPRKKLNIAEGKGPTGVRGGRITWVLDGKFLVVSGFNRSSERQVHMYKANDVSSVATISIDVSPSILVPFYDEDSSILLLSGRGDTTIFAFDVSEDTPYLQLINTHRCPGVHQGLTFLKKNACCVKDVEFAKALRLTELAVEPWSFTVPRVKSEFFQDDLFPPTRVLWKSSMTSAEWFSGENIQPKRISLKPPNMNSLGELNSNKTKIVKSDHPTDNPVAPQYSSLMADKFGEKKQQDMVEQAIKDKIIMNTKLEQDEMEGVDENEWYE